MPYPYATTVDLLGGIPLKPSDENQIKFASATARESYFAGKVVKEEVNVQYMREDGRYACKANYDEIIGKCNYLRYRNQGRWFYAYVTNIEYANVSMCWIDFEIDSYMTYQFDIVWKDCFIERECVSDDTPGKNLIDEGIELGEFEYYSMNTAFPGVQSNGNLKLTPVIFTTQALVYDSQGKPTPSSDYKGIINNLPSSIAMWAPVNVSNVGESAKEIIRFTNWLADNGKADTILYACLIPINIFPVSVIDGYIFVNGNSPSTSLGCYYNFSTSATLSIDYDFNFSLDILYTPKNNKLYDYPFNLYLLSNNEGNIVELRPNNIPAGAGDIKSKTIAFRFSLYIAPDSILFCIPKNYLTFGQMFTSAIENFPTLPLTTNAYANWLSGHASTLTVNGLTSAAQIIGGGVSTAAGNPAGITSIASGVSSIAGIVAKISDAAKVPYSAVSGIGKGGNYVAGKQSHRLWRRALKLENYQWIDNYFSMYGYKVNRMATPQFRTRQYWNFYKIPICNIYGNIPGEDIERIKDMFNRGITLWNTTDVGNYHNGDNPIL